MKIFNYILLCVLPLVFSCQKNSSNEIWGEPDKTIENETGTLHHFIEMKMWSIQHGYPGFIDSVDIYLIKEINKDFHFEEGKKVTVSGSCYFAEKAFPVSVGTTVYDIIITNLTYNEMGEPDKTIENVTGILHYSSEMEMWEIQYGYPGTIDSVDVYLIKETNEDFHFEEGKKVTVSGSCYFAEVSYPVPVGTTVYYITITNLTYE
jgi:hypothetical protein